MNQPLNITNAMKALENAKARVSECYRAWQALQSDANQAKSAYERAKEQLTSAKADFMDAAKAEVAD